MKRNLTLKRSMLTCAFIALVPISASANSMTGFSDYQNHIKAKSSRTLVNVSGEVTQGAQNFIQNVSARGLAFLQNETLSEEDRKKEFGLLLRQSFDLKTIGRFALGTYWRQASEKEQKEYLKLFEDMVINTYAKRFKEYQGQQVVVDRARPEGQKDTIVNSRIVSTDGAPDVQLDWRIRYKNGEYRVIDVLVEGVSMSLTQRSEFSSIIQRGGGAVEALLTKLRER